jgi:hypothetical protein
MTLNLPLPPTDALSPRPAIDESDPSNSREILQKISQRMTTIEIIKQCLNKHASSNKARRAAHDLRINSDDTRFHVANLARHQILASVDSSLRRRPHTKKLTTFDLSNLAHQRHDTIPRVLYHAPCRAVVSPISGMPRQPIGNTSAKRQKQWPVGQVGISRRAVRKQRLHGLAFIWLHARINQSAARRVAVFEAGRRSD